MNVMEVRGPFRFGALTVHQIIEFDGPAVPYDVLLQKASAEEFEAALSGSGRRRVDENGMVSLATQVIVVRGPAGIALIDAGPGNAKERPQEPYWHRLALPFLATLRGLGIEPEDVSFVYLSHFHPDHVGFSTELGADGVWQPSFPNTRYVADHREIDYFMSLASEHPRYHPCLDDSIRPLQAAGLLHAAAPGDVIGDFRLHDGAGHTPGHMLLEAVGSEEALWFVGDLFHHPAQVARPDWPAGEYDLDATAAIETRRRYLRRFAESGAWVYAHHTGNAVRICGDESGWRVS